MAKRPFVPAKPKAASQIQVSTRSLANDRFFQRLASVARSPFMPVIADQRRPRIELKEILQNTPAAMQIVLSCGRKLWLEKRNCQLAGNHVFVDRHITVQDGLV